MSQMQLTLSWIPPFYPLFRNSSYNFSTRLLTLLTTSVIVHIEQKIKSSLAGYTLNETLAQAGLLL